ncbi:uncharacterized protein HMPREF1541_02019 [Cyphellophora europaea CBS 101466]|uniref:Uncharacterized protein n=1 Tax=Cyphellophora europaea (strain CBS 101466) TaxID=1220924 RepID=W2S2D4_CYPE1|nr:uncharacterized protein HMPREF1541_02019 [Cyphellophora europaea CBS 101466]ETN42861.1 hypothetical protein HMPREF1541_02019 [Cyphellophora europaea CBS 101466]
MWQTAASYATLIVVGSAVYCYYNPAAVKKLFPQPAPPTTQEARPQSKRVKQKRVSNLSGDDKAATTATSSTDTPVSKKRKIISAPVGQQISAKTVDDNKVALPRVEDDGMSNADFAAQLRQAQTGTQLEKKDQQAPSKKERRAAQAAPKTAEGFESPSLSADTSSTGGRDADDDMSPNATPPSSVSRAGDISDMLESGPAKPNTIRLTSTESAQQKKPTPKQFETVLTKKQRQRRQQQEENRLLKEESDKQHEAKKQQQMRTARMAGGTSNQTKASNFTANAWQPKATENQAPVSQPSGGALLDTFDHEENKQSVSTKPISDITNRQGANVEDAKEEMGEKKTAALAASQREGNAKSQQDTWADQLNADEQDKWAQKLMEDEWTDVSSKKAKKKNRKDNQQDTSSEASQPLTAKGPSVKALNGSQANDSTKPQNRNRFEAVSGDDVWEA